MSDPPRPPEAEAPKCPACGRPVALARARCLYCAAPLPAALVGAARSAAPEPSAAPATERRLPLLDFGAAEQEALARALGLGLFEADQRRRRGGLELLRAGEAEPIEAEAARLAAEGLRVVTVPEAEAQARPERAVGGLRDGECLRLKTVERSLVVEGRDLLLVVRGPIVRERQKPQRGHAIWSNAILRALDIDMTERRHGDGYRIHLHRRSELRPLELDPDGFDFSRGVAASSSLLELTSWIDAIAPGTPSDDGFRRLAAVLAPAPPEAEDLATAFGRRPSGRRRGADDVLLDNVGQFRFYSGWRAAYERRRSAL